MTSFSQADKKELNLRLNRLRQVCYPSVKLAVPKFKFKTKKDFLVTDHLSYASGYDIPPSELKDLWQDRETLRDNNVDYIIAKGKKWFYNILGDWKLEDSIFDFDDDFIDPEALTNSEILCNRYPLIVADFYSKDGNKKVEMNFPFWMDVENIWETPGVLDAVKKVLEKCSGQTFPSQEEAAACFPQKLLRKIHDKNPSREGIELAVLEMMETLCKKIMAYLEQNHVQDVLKEPGFLAFSQQNNTQPNKPDAQKVKEYLAGNKQAMYFLAQKFGLIKNAARIIRYEEMRDHVRHPDKVKPLPIHPRRIYRDFVSALDIPSKNASRAKTIRPFDENADIVQHLSDMNRIWTILDRHVDPKLVKKKNKPAYYQDLIDKGLLTEEEAKIIRRRRLATNEVAHLNHNVKRARQKVMNDTKLSELASEIYDRHIEKIRRWIDETSHTI